MYDIFQHPRVSAPPPHPIPSLPTQMRDWWSTRVMQKTSSQTERGTTWRWEGGRCIFNQPYVKAHSRLSPWILYQCVTYIIYVYKISLNAPRSVRASEEINALFKRLLGWPSQLIIPFIFPPLMFTVCVCLNTCICMRARAGSTRAPSQLWEDHSSVHLESRWLNLHIFSSGTLLSWKYEQPSVPLLTCSCRNGPTGTKEQISFIKLRNQK